MKSSHLEILGLGTAVPRHYLRQRDAAAVAVHLAPGNGQLSQRIYQIYERSRIQQRHCVLLTSSSQNTPTANSRPDDRRGLELLNHHQLYRERLHDGDQGPTTSERMEAYVQHAAPLACEAAAQALSRANCSATDVSHLVTVSCTGFSAPGFDIQLIRSLGLPKTVSRTHIGFMGCHGALNGLRAARALAAAHPGERVLLCCAELCSVHQQYSDRLDHVIANSLFGDGAAAVVGRAHDGGGTVASTDKLCLVASNSLLIDEHGDAMRWEIGDHGFAMTLSPRIAEILRETATKWIEEWLARHGLANDQVAGWCIHPGGPKIVQAVGQALRLSDSQLAPTFDILAQYGNMSSPTVLFILERLLERQTNAPIVLLAFGPGLTVEAALLR